MNLNSFRTLGRSGLVVSPMALGTMTFAAPGWGSNDDASEAVFNAYIDAGGNFVDTADVYGGGRSEEIVGRCVAQRSLRDHVVLATKFTFNSQRGNPNAGGNGRKNIFRSLETSLKRLRTDYIDLYWMHYWDQTTPVDEVVETFGSLQQQGKIRYFGFSDVPAWYATKACVLAGAAFRPPPIALQMEYSLIERSVEREHIPMAAECGLGVIPWGPLGSGFLTGKYQRGSGKPEGEGRFSSQQPFREFTDKHWSTLSALEAIAKEFDRPLSQVALAWTIAQPGISAILLGASKPEQLKENMAALQVTLNTDQVLMLDEASALEPAHPYAGFTPAVKRNIFGGNDVPTWAPSFARTY